MNRADAPLKKIEEPRGIFERSSTWLYSQKHFHMKLLSGTAAGVVVIALLASLFLYVTWRNNQKDALRNHTIEFSRFAASLENDIGGLEANHRGFLLTGDPTFAQLFHEREHSLQQHLSQIATLVVDSAAQRKRIIKVQEITQNWLTQVGLPSLENRRTGVASPGKPALGAAELNEARGIVESLANEEQIALNGRSREMDWGTRSAQILDFLAKLERSIISMSKERRGFQLTAEPAYADAYRHAVSDFFVYESYLSILSANSPQQLDTLKRIRSGVENWIQVAAEADGRSAKDQATAASTAESVMATIRQLLTDYENNEASLYQARSTHSARERMLETAGLATLSILAICLLIASNSYGFALVRRQLTKVDGIETRIRSIIENILDGMITVDENGVIRSMNPAAEKMFGCINNELVGHNFTKLVPKSYGPEVESEPVPCNWHDLAQRTGTTSRAIGRTRTHQTFPIEISLSEMALDEDHSLYVAMARDVTERERFEREIASDKESLAITLRSIGDGVITTDVQGRIIMINNAGESLTGWSSREAIGQPLKSVFNISIDLAAQARAQKSGYRNEAQSLLLSLPENATLRSREGEEYVIEQVASPIRDGNNEVAGVVLVFRDITERQRNDAERRKAEALEQLGLLAGGIAHDFNNLLTAIIGNISLASLLLPPNDEMGIRLNDAKNASMRARDLAQQLLTFARGGAPIKKTSSIGKLIQDTVSFSLRGTHSRSEFEMDDELWAAEIDPGQISQVVANLVVNADQAMPNGGTLHVACKNFTYGPEAVPAIPDLLPGEYIKISIQDEGVGIPEEAMKRIFDPYFTTKAKGTGLGLATTYSIMKNHNGLITVDSQVHQGATFTLYLPALRNHELPNETPSAATNEPVHGSGRILIVDDEEAIRALVEFTLARFGYEVDQAETALEGVQMYQKNLEAGKRFDVVILDLTLPGGMGGKEALKRLIDIDPTVNAIVSSGYAMDATMSRFQDYGFRGVIAKPYEAAELARIVHDVIESSRVNITPDFGNRLPTARVA